LFVRYLLSLMSCHYLSCTYVQILYNLFSHSVISEESSKWQMIVTSCSCTSICNSYCFEVSFSAVNTFTVFFEDWILITNDQRMIPLTILKNFCIIIYVFVIVLETTESLKPPPVKAKVDNLLKAPTFSKDWTKDWTKSPLFSGPKIPKVTRETTRNIKVILITIHSVNVINGYHYYFITYFFYNKV
jgi:hypothetical protein